MRLRPWWLATIGVMAIAGANWIGWQAIRSPGDASLNDVPMAGVSGSEAADFADSWRALNGVTTDDERNTFPPALQAREGQTLTLRGVLFTVPQLVHEGRVTAAVLAPPAKFSCCGLSCDAGSTMVCVIPRDPLADPGRRRLARVTGVLHLHPEADGLTAIDLRAADVTWLPDP